MDKRQFNREMGRLILANQQHDATECTKILKVLIPGVTRLTKKRVTFLLDIIFKHLLTEVIHFIAKDPSSVRIGDRFNSRMFANIKVLKEFRDKLPDKYKDCVKDLTLFIRRLFNWYVMGDEVPRARKCLICGRFFYQANKHRAYCGKYLCIHNDTKKSAKKETKKGAKKNVKSKQSNNNRKNKQNKY